MIESKKCTKNMKEKENAMNNKDIREVMSESMKKLLCVLFITIAMIGITGCNGSKSTKLSENDLRAYNYILEVCYLAKDPSKVEVISGTAGKSLGVFKVSYNDGEEIYNVLVNNKDGKYEVEKIHDEVVSMYSDLIYATDSFDASRVNKALKDKWKK